MKSIPTILLLAIVHLIAGTTFSQSIAGTYAIKNAETGIYLRIKDANTKDGTPIVAYSPVNWKCVTWDFKHIDNNTYQLANLFSGKTLQPKQAPADKVGLEEQPLSSGANNQQFEFIPVEKDYYLIRLKGTDLYLTPSDGKGTVNAPIVLAKKNNTKLQYWTLHEQHPTM